MAAAFKSVVIPRFLLPLQGPLWRGLRVPPPGAARQLVRVRYASSSRADGKPIVLEKPARFNPPSHGSRLRSKALPKHYSPPLSEVEVQARSQRHYPATMAPAGSWQHWFWHSKLLHTFITMGTLFAMGIFTFFMNYAYNSPYKDLVPPTSALLSDPAYFFAAWKEVILSHEKDKALKAGEHRTRHLDDVAKRRYYMKVHGIEPKDPISVVFGKGDRQLSDAEIEAAALGKEMPEKTPEEETAGKRKKWFGIF
ncbi:hypothetical protein ISF_08518 [Cordyceps fumosorosea ARSEF 2679]|uniref:Uncharacterized protein n=1 Tax=Cordyceps fumosorosea (strain ARSEF 2679) TaxID=1081104 RepID=A0A162K6L0_CORFA|nr:hypothetical protein ISF_08518 [Cordyceps fumosorosea ARSEF 2679]OAA54038.1 hypothetical protein ISF_08518 [Cordyceps fumosorosea ARSEF 2679]